MHEGSKMDFSVVNRGGGKEGRKCSSGLVLKSVGLRLPRRSLALS